MRRKEVPKFYTDFFFKCLFLFLITANRMKLRIKRNDFKENINKLKKEFKKNKTELNLRKYERELKHSSHHKISDRVHWTTFS